MSESAIPITKFLSARIAEDEERAGSARMWFPSDAHDGMDETPWMDAEWWESVGLDARHSEFCARHDPARVLAECEAKRRIVEDYEEYAADYRTAPSDFATGRRHAALLAVTRAAAIYADHPDYRAEWKP